MTSLQQTAMLGGAASAKVASYTLVAADAGTAISMNSASATTITVNTALFAEGDTVQITNLGAGVCTITAGTATVNTASSLALEQYGSGTLDFTSTSASIFYKSAGAAVGAMTLISTTSLTGATTTISSIPSGYIDLYLLISGVSNATADGNFRCAPNASSSSGNNITISGTTIENNQGDYILFNKSTSLLARATTTNVFAFTINDYASATSRKAFSIFGQYQSTGPAQQTVVAGGGFGSTTAITSLVFSNSGGNLSTGTVLLYGVK
jgi:hypothetical protein